MKQEKNKFFIRAINNAKEIFSNKEKVIETLDSAFQKSMNLESDKGEISKLTDKVKLFIRMIRSYVQGEYRDVPLKTIILIFASLIYFINPFDPTVHNYLYNVLPGMYDEVVFVTERSIQLSTRKQLVEIFDRLGVQRLQFVSLVEEMEGEADADAGTEDR